MPQRIWISQANPWQSAQHVSFETKGNLSAFNVPNGVILPPKKANEHLFLGGVCDENFVFQAGLIRAQNTQNLDWCGIVGAYRVFKIQKINESVIFGGVLMGHFGHFLIESLTRLWYLIENPNDLRKIVFLLFDPWGWEKKFIEECFELLNIPSHRILIITDALQFENVFIPEESAHLWESFNEKYNLIYEKLIENAKLKYPHLKTFDKIYLTHSNWKKAASLANENVFEDFFKSLNFRILSPETFNFAEQIVYLNSAKEVVTTMGSVAHLGLFCQKETFFVVLTRERNVLFVPQLIIHQARKLNWFIIDTAQNFLYSAPFCTTANLCFSKDFCHFAQHYWGENLNLEFFKKQTRFDHYIQNWFLFYKNPQNFQSIRHLSAFDFLNKMAEELEGKSLNQNDYLAPFWIRFYRFLRKPIRRCFSKYVPHVWKIKIYQKAEQSPKWAKILGIPFKF